MMQSSKQDSSKESFIIVNHAEEEKGKKTITTGNSNHAEEEKGKKTITTGNSNSPGRCA